MVKQCWCGNSSLLEFSPDYLKCADCQTLVTRRSIEPIHDKVMDDEKGFYGKEYWFGFQEKLGYPNIEKRARMDLPERCLHWLETLLKHRLPPAKVLEIGSAHGGFVALMRQAGYDAAGLELSPSIAKLAEQTFSIPTFCGPVEDQKIAAGSLDAIVMMDVFEHLPRPAKTIRHCLELLKPEGFFFIQTPRFPEGITHEDLLLGKSAFLEQLKPDEHLYLFSMESVKKFLQRLDLAFVSFEAPAFPKYDMALVAARTQLRPTKEEDRNDCLQKTTSSRMIQAMLDMRGQLQRSGTVMKKQAEEISYLRKRDPRRIAVDLTPILPGGANGGAKIVAQELIKNLGLLAPECEFVLLTSDQNHDELAVLDSPNIRRLCVLHGAAGSESPARPLARKEPLLSKLRDRLSAFVPDTVIASLIGFYRRLSRPAEYTGLMQTINPDLLFCPFTAPFYYHPTVPTVSVIHEILFLRYPQFFQPAVLNARYQHFRNACRLADRLVCVSEDLRQDVLKHVQLSPDRLVTVPNRMSRRFGDPAAINGLARLKTWMLEDKNYLLYPANFWPHKNHRMLFAAFGMHVKKHPGGGLKLACPGAPVPGLEPLKQAVKLMGLEDKIIFPGYADEHDMAILFKHCRAVIYPTLYEGFGMPVLEAAVFGKPVLASKTPTTQEIAGSSVYYFDARKPADIAEAIEIAHNSPEDLPVLSPAASAVNRFSDTRQMAAEYLEVFKDALNRYRPEVSFSRAEGIHPDGWISERAVVFHDAVKAGWLEIEACLPDFFPYPVSYLQIRQCKTSRLSVHLIRREKSSIIRWNLPESGGSLELAPQPLYQPKAHGFNDDERWLGCLIKRIELVTPSKREKIYEGPFA